MSLNCPFCGNDLVLRLGAPTEDLGVPTEISVVPQTQPQTAAASASNGKVEAFEGVRVSTRSKYQYNDQAFQLFWKLYPRRVSKASAFAKWRIARRDVPAEVILEGVRRYARWIAINHVEQRFIKHPDSWLNGAGWDDEYNNPPEVGETNPAFVKGTPEWDERIQAEEDAAIEAMS